MTSITYPALGAKNPPVLGDLNFKKKKGHDLAYLVIILAILFGTFLFAMVVMNSMLRNFG